MDHLNPNSVYDAERERLVRAAPSPLALQAVGQLATEEVVNLGTPSTDQVDRVVKSLQHLGEYSMLGVA